MAEDPQKPLKEQILRELSEFVVDDNTVAFFSVTLTKGEDEVIHTTVTVFGASNVPYERRVYLSDAIINIAQRMREQE